MTWIINTILILLGGLMYRIRGGLEIIPDKKLPLNKLWWATYCTIVCWYLYNWTTAFWIWTLLITCWIACRMSTQIAGWSKYVVAACMGELKDPFEIEVYTIDRVLNSLHITIKGKVIHLYDYPYLYGIVGMGMRGLLLTFIVGLCFHSVWYMLCGALLGVIYWLGGLTDRYIISDGKGGWNISEIYTGMYLIALGLLWWR